MYQVWKRLSHGQRTDNAAHGESSPGAEPGADHLHRRRIHPCQASSGDESPEQRALQAVGGQHHRVCRRAAQRTHREQATGRNHIRKIQNGAGSCTRDEAQLNHRRQPGRVRSGQLPQLSVLCRDGARREPERHAK